MTDTTRQIDPAIGERTRARIAVGLRAGTDLRRPTPKTREDR